ncbi:MAG: LysR family transcriptional regulator [Burkholderiales bacterium]|nr:LysR family transcriptional regulator [Burkholderiales bacterium]
MAKTEPTLDLKSLHAFCCVATHGSFTRAAAAEGLIQSILSRRISALERAIGVRLLHRTGRGVVPTEFGERLLPRAKTLLADADAFHDVASGLDGDLRGIVDIGVVPAARHLIGALCARLERDHPRVRLRAIEGYSGAVEDWLATGRIDIGMFNRYQSRTIRSAELLLRAEMLLVSAPGHPATRRAEVPFKALDGLPLGAPTQPNSLVDLLSGLANSQHIHLNLVLEAGSTAIILDAIMQSDMCTVYPRRVVARELASGELASARIVKPALVQTTWLALGTQRPLSEAARLVARLTREIALEQASSH